MTLRQTILTLFLVLPLASLNAQDLDLSDTSKYPWYHPEMNYIQFYNRTAVNAFYTKWKAGKSERISIVHTGDSHIQSDISTSIARKNLQLIRGDGGRGMMFPYSIAKTYSSIKYSSTHTGEWEFGKTMLLPPKVPLGITGMAGITKNSNASFKITFNEDQPDHYRSLRIYCKRVLESFDLVVESAGFEYLVTVYQEGDTLPFVSIDLKQLGPSISVKCVGGEGKQFFELHGLELLSNKSGGLVYHAVGVGGSRFRGMLHKAHLISHLTVLKPDMVILDFGTNDYLYDDLVKDELPNEIREIVKRIRQAAPNTAILLTSTQDLYYKRRNIRSGDKFADLMTSLAQELDCLFWDWYWVSGGRMVLKKWQAQGLAQADLIHLTGPGYRLKGRLLSEAILSTISMLDENSKLERLVLQTDSLKALQAIRIEKEQQIEPAGVIQPSGNYVVYKIKSGDTLGHIAQRHGVSVKQLQQWNNLKGTMIIAGKTLIIYK